MQKGSIKLGFVFLSIFLLNVLIASAATPFYASSVSSASTDYTAGGLDPTNWIASITYGVTKGNWGYQYGVLSTSNTYTSYGNKPSSDSALAITLYQNIGQQIITITTNNGVIKAYLPQSSGNSMTFYVASDGSTYYANSQHIAAKPDLTVTEALTSQHLARAAEQQSQVPPEKSCTGCTARSAGSEYRCDYGGAFNGNGNYICTCTKDFTTECTYNGNNVCDEGETTSCETRDCGTSEQKAGCTVGCIYKVCGWNFIYACDANKNYGSLYACKCYSGENCRAAACGNGICESNTGETYAIETAANCPDDCGALPPQERSCSSCLLREKGAEYRCDYGGAFNSNGNHICTCTKSYSRECTYNGDNVCDSGETAACETRDCGSAEQKVNCVTPCIFKVCGWDFEYACNINKNSGSGYYCKCYSGENCQATLCGNGICESNTGETYAIETAANCPSDCATQACTSGWKCKDANTKGYQDANCAWSNLTTCTYGCSNGNCNAAPPTPDPCSGVVCNNPQNQCYNSPGTCVNGNCTYTLKPSGISCNDDNACTANDVCNGAGVCSGTAINCPDLCQDSTTLKYGGYCSGGSCIYQTKACTYGCENNACKNQTQPIINQTICTDLALKKAAYASGYYSDGYPSKAVDGDDSTVWRSSQSNGAWLYVDLGNTYTINKVVAMWAWDTRFGSSAISEIQVSTNAASWATVVSSTRTKSNNGEKENLTFSTINARYVRFYAKQWNGGWAHMNTFEVYPESCQTNQTIQKADLIPTEISYPSIIREGDSVLFDSGVKNIGNKDSSGFNIKWFADGNQVAYGPHNGIPAGQTVITGNSRYSWTATYGTHAIKFVVDADNNVDESNENNNEISATFIVLNKTEKIFDGKLTIATKNSSYKIGELVELTDPPAEEATAEETKPKLAIDNRTKPKVYGYIVQFKEKPLLEYKAELEESIAEKEDKLKDLTTAEKITKEPIMAITLAIDKWRYDPRIKSQEEKILFEHMRALEEIKQKVPGITGHVVYRPSRRVIGEYKNIFNGIALDISEEEAKSINNSNYVKNIYPNNEVQAFLQNSVPYINADDVWQLSDSLGRKITGEGITIAVIDTGIDYTHNDLGGCLGENCKVIGGYDFANNDNNPIDDHGHGTHVASTAAGNGNLKGVAPDAKLLAYKVLNSGGSGSEANVMSGIERAIDPNNDGDYSDHADIISMSLGNDFSQDPDDAMSQTVDNAVKAGVVAVVAAGNFGPNYGTAGSPGVARKAITVGAACRKDQLDTYTCYNEVAFFSARGPTLIGTMKPDIVAPGVKIYAAIPGNSYKTASGTSMATPHISGVAALILQNHPDWAPEEVKAAIRNSGIDLGFDHNTQGYGLVDALNAVTAENAPVAELTTSGVVGGSVKITGTAKSKNFKNYELYYGEGFEASAWNLITTENKQVSENVLFGNWDITGLKDGTYNLRLVVSDANGVKSEDRTLFYTENVYISSPKQNEVFYEKGFPYPYYLEIRGTVVGKNFLSYNIEYGFGENPTSWYSEGIILKNAGSLPVSNNVLGYWDFKNIAVGKYTIKLTAYFSDRTEEEKVVVFRAKDKPAQPGWPIVKSFGATWNYVGATTPIMADLDKDGSSEIIGVIGLDTGYFIYVWDADGIEKPGWPKSFKDRSGGSGYTPAVADLDGDGKLEIIIGEADEKPATVYAWRYDGTGFLNSDGTFATAKGYIYSAPAIADLDGDGRLEIIQSTSDIGGLGYIYVWKADGTGFSSSTGEFASISAPTGFHATPSVGDIDKDGKPEIVAVAYNGPLFVWRNNGKLVFSKEFGNYYFSDSTPLGDLDGDGDLEIVLTAGGTEGYPQGVIALHHDGTLTSPSWPKGGTHARSVALGDIDNDGKNEIIAVTDTTPLSIHAYKYDGSEASGWPVTLNKWSYTNSIPTIADVDGDGKSEVIVGVGSFYEEVIDGETWVICCEPKKVYVFEGDGSISPDWPYLTKECNNFMSAVTLKDVDNDGKSEMLFACFYLYFGGEPVSGTIYEYLLDLQKIYNKEKTEWETYNNNIRHTGLYGDPNELPTLPSKCGNNIKEPGEECDGSDAALCPGKCLINCKCPPKTCSDGTEYGKCSVTKPKYCDNGNLINKCSVCKCDSGYSCQVDESCKLTQPIPEPKPALPKSMINNTGTENITGHLTMKVQIYTPVLFPENTGWVDEKLVVNNLNKTIYPGTYMALDTLWIENGAYNATKTGKFKAYAEMRDEKGYIIKTASGELKAEYEFEVK